jgi:hypothetical protein
VRAALSIQRTCYNECIVNTPKRGQPRRSDSTVHGSFVGVSRGLVRVALPAKGAGRERWLTRSEAATLLWTCWRYRECKLNIGAL